MITGADITGLQTFLPYNTLTSFIWHNSSLPTTPNQTQPADFTGLDWDVHGRLVNFAQPNPAEANISEWMIRNPHRINVGRISLWFGGSNVTEEDIGSPQQTLDLYSGVLVSSFEWKRETIEVTTVADPSTTTISVVLDSSLLTQGGLGAYLDFPYMTDQNKFEEPFVGLWNTTANHTTTLAQQGANQARIQHDEDTTTYYATVHWDGEGEVSGPLPDSHQYILKPQGNGTRLAFTVSYHDDISPQMSPFYSPEGQGKGINTSPATIKTASQSYWRSFWENGAFVDLTSTNNSNATELQRRTIQSQYLLAVNEAGFDPPQESGLTNNGWYGKFHAEMYAWHLGQWARWGRWDLLDRSLPQTYQRFLDSSIERATRQGYKGARWGKMTDPTGRSAPGEINSLLIWQQPHPMPFAEYEWRAFPYNDTLEKWSEVLYQTAEFMADFAFWNESTCVYDLGPPMYPVSENTDPNATMNPTFELAYWRFGLDTAAEWQRRQGKPVPEKWTHVAQNLAPLPIQNGTYVIYEGIEDMWTTPEYTEDHQSMLMLNGWLPPPPADAGWNSTIMDQTVDRVYETWNFTYSYGWDFPLLSMNSARMGNINQSVAWLLDEDFGFDDAGYPIGGTRVPTPYFPGSASLLWAVALLAGGWDGSVGPHFPEDWTVEVEGFSPAL